MDDDGPVRDGDETSGRAIPEIGLQSVGRAAPKGMPKTQSFERPTEMVARDIEVEAIAVGDWRSVCPLRLATKSSWAWG